MLHSRSSRISSAALAAIVVAGLVSIPSVRNEATTRTHHAHTQAVLLSSVTNTSALDAVLSASQDGTPGNVTAPETQATPSAASVIDDTFGPLAFLIRFANLLLLPIWYLAFPITLPLAVNVVAQKFGAALSGYVFPLYFAAGPLALFELLNPSTSSAPSANPSAARSADGTSTSTESYVDATNELGAEVLAAAKAIPAAAETTEENPFETPLGQVLIALNFLVLPLWFLAAPITLPLSMLAAASRLPDTDSPLNSLLFLAGTGIAFLTGPLGALSMLLQPDPTPAAAVRASAARSITPVTESDGDIASDSSLSATNAGGDIRRTATAPRPVRGQVMELRSDARPVSAAASRVGADGGTNGPKAVESPELAHDDGTESAESPDARDDRASAKANTGGRNR